MRDRIIYSLLIVLFFSPYTSCYNYNKESSKIRIDYDKEAIFKWEDIIEIDSVITIGDTDSVLLGFTNKCLITDKQIVYYDQTQECIFTFNHKGRLLYKIDNTGMGDKEFVNIKDVCLSYDKTSILVLDNISVLIYNITNGRMENRIYLSPDLCSNFYMLINPSKNKFLFWSIDSNISLYSFDGQNYKAIQVRDGYYFVSQKFYEYPPNEYNLIADYGLFKVSSLKENKVVAKYEFDLGKYTFPKKLMPENNREFNMAEESPYFRSILKAYEVNNCLFINTLSPDGDFYNIVYNKNNNRIFSGVQDKESPLAIVGTI